jgi:multidrug efflux pump subunit AcrA (membrane-fusion protein)
MRNTIIRPWLTMLRHEDPDPVDPAVDPEVVDPVVDLPADPAEDLKPDTGAGKDAAETAKWKALSRKHEAKAKENADAAKELAALKASQLSETEKLAAAKDAAEKRAAAAVERAVNAEVRALAVADFADPSDAVDAIRAAEFVNSEGEIDLDAVKAKLADLLDAKPHWKKAPAAAPVALKPKPDPSQGARTPAGPTNFKTAPREELTAELAKYGARLR